VTKAGQKHDHDSADIVCDRCKSIVATLHAPKAQRARARPKEGRKGPGDGGSNLGPPDGSISN
jgi:hypothetical protein